LIGIFGVLRVVVLSPQFFTLLTCGVIVINSLWDLWGAASFYILVDDESALNIERKWWPLRQPRRQEA
jgi:hypothetical protein